jgi:hypothetical protein
MKRHEPSWRRSRFQNFTFPEWKPVKSGSFSSERSTFLVKAHYSRNLTSGITVDPSGIPSLECQLGVV